MNYKVSVIIPVYNGEKFLRRAIDSVVNQSYDGEYEVLLVDDGSKDGTAAICKEYAERFPFVHYFYHDNRGISKTRERAVELAQGEYLCWVDADDYVSSDLLKLVMEKLEEAAPDICAFSYRGICEDGKITDHLMEDFSLKEWRKRSIMGKTTPVWSYISKKELWQNVNAPWEVAKSGEDAFMTVTVFGKAKSIIPVGPILYYHIEDNPDSIMHTVSGLRMLGGGYAFYHRFKIAGKDFPDIADKVGNNALRWLTRAYAVSAYLKDLKEEEREKIRTYILEVADDMKQVNFRNKYRVFLVRHQLNGMIEFLGKISYKGQVRKNNKNRK